MAIDFTANQRRTRDLLQMSTTARAIGIVHIPRGEIESVCIAYWSMYTASFHIL